MPEYTRVTKFEHEEVKTELKMYTDRRGRRGSVWDEWHQVKEIAANGQERRQGRRKKVQTKRPATLYVTCSMIRYLAKPIPIPKNTTVWNWDSNWKLES